MALLTVEIPERLLAKLRRSGRPEQEVIVEALEQTLTTGSHQKRELSPEEVERRLLDSGFVRNPEEYDNEDVRAWLALPETERSQIIEEMESLWFPDSPASRAIIEGRG